MSAELGLVPLDCASCGAPLAAEGEDVVFYCTACRSGFRLWEGEAREEGGPARLEPVEVSFLADPARPAERYFPFWLLPARVSLDRRGSGDLFTGLLGFFFSGSEESGSDPGDGVFAVPAHPVPLERMVELTLAYTRELGTVRRQGGLTLLGRAEELPAERLTGGTLTVGDARKLAEYALIASEARKVDTLKDLQYHLSWKAPRLLGVPFRRQGTGWVDLRFGLPG